MILKSFIHALVFAACTVCAQTNEPSKPIAYKGLGKSGEDIASRLAEFDFRTNHLDLFGVSVLLDRVTATNAGMSVALRKINLEVLNRAMGAIDPGWDFSTAKRPHTKVAPRLPGGGLGLAGTDPESIEDPDLRKQYIAAIGENERALRAYERELILRKTIDKCLFRAKNHLLATANSQDAQGISEAVADIGRVSHPGTRVLLFQTMTNALNRNNTPK